MGNKRPTEKSRQCIEESSCRSHDLDAFRGQRRILLAASSRKSKLTSPELAINRRAGSTYRPNGASMHIDAVMSLVQPSERGSFSKEETRFEADRGDIRQIFLEIEAVLQHFSQGRNAYIVIF